MLECWRCEKKMSNIVGGGVNLGLTEDEVNTLIGRGEANGTAGLNAAKNLLVPGNTIKMIDGLTAGTILVSTGGENCLKAVRISSNTFEPRTFKNGVETKLLDASDRNGATATGVAAIYNPCKTLYNEHRPVCTKEYHLVGKYLDGADNPDVWFPIKGVGANASVSYANRVLSINSGNGAVSASRCVIDQTKFPITSNFLEVTCEIDNIGRGEGGSRKSFVGFQSAFSTSIGVARCGFELNGSGADYCIVGIRNKALTGCAMGRNLQSGDIVTVRLGRQEGSSNIDIARLYVNGQKQYEDTTIPTENVYAGIGAFAENSLVDVGCSLGIKYFGVRYVP